MAGGPWEDYQRAPAASAPAESGAGPWADYRPTPEQSVKRAAGLTGRSLIEGALSLPGVVLGGAGGIYNTLADLGTPGGVSYAGSKLRPDLKQTVVQPSGPFGTLRFKDQNQQLERALTQFGFPEPQGFTEKAGNVLGQMIGGAVATPNPSAMFPKPLYQSPLPAGQVSAREFADYERRAAGYKVPPSQAGQGSFLENKLESIAGKAALKQEATQQNQAVTQKLAGADAGLAKGIEPTPGNLAAAREDLAAPYREVSSLSRTAALTLEKLKQAKYDANAEWMHYWAGKDPAVKKSAELLTQKVNKYESIIDREASLSGVPDLLSRLREARQALAKNYQVGEASNLIGEVNAPALVKDPEKLTGNLAAIARFVNTYPKFAGPGSGVPTPGVSALEPVAGLGAGMAASAMTGSPVIGAGTGGLLASLGAPARSFLMSDFYQNPQAVDWARRFIPLIAGAEGTRGLLSPDSR